MSLPFYSSYQNPIASKISIKPSRRHFEVLSSPSNHVDGVVHTDLSELGNDLIREALDKDNFPIPVTADREEYHGNRHFDWWLSGLRDSRNVIEAYKTLQSTPPKRIFELGAATGRVTRHFSTHLDIDEVWACDLNTRHVDWIRKFLPKSIRVFDNCSLPILPIADNYIDAVCAFSVFTHIDDFEMAWLSEIRRILRPGGIAFITVHTEDTWESMRPDWPLYNALETGAISDYGSFEDLKQKSLPHDRVVFWWENATTYNSDVFHKKCYINSEWGRFFEVKKIWHRHHDYQDVVLLQKREF